ncbi:MAG: DNA polymerase III subunit alpha [Opitutales bacterium]|nr:DNA polymerase III subunit alpha [Opitutales bacterium]
MDDLFKLGNASGSLPISTPSSVINEEGVEVKRDAIVLDDVLQNIPDTETVPKEERDFVHLHLHSQFSMLDGATRIDNLINGKTKEIVTYGLVAKAQEYKMRAVALTDHGNMFGSKLFYDTCRKTENPHVKPIIGCEVYVAREDHKKRNLRSGNHLILLAKNLTGYHNLVRLVSIAWTEGFFAKPRIDHDLLEKYHEGLICSSACIAGEIPSAILKGNFEEAERAAQWFKNLFGDDFYLEVMRHPNNVHPETRDTYYRQLKANDGIFKIAQKLGIKVIATNDVHFLNKEDADAHEILLCLSTGKKLSDEKRLRYTRQEWFKSQKEMATVWNDHPEVLANTLEIADKVEEYELNSPPIMPFFPIPKDFGSEEEYRKKYSEEDLLKIWDREHYEKHGGYEKVLRIKLECDYLEHLAFEGAKKRWPDGVPPAITEQLKFELGVIRTMGFPGYFLIVQDFIAAARDLGVVVGPGRGSAAGCLVAYCLKITNVEPTKYELLFERFLNPDRISMPDIDIDFDDEGRGKVLEWVTDKYGQDHVSHIATFGIMAPKSAIKDVARVIDLPLSTSNQLAKLVPDTPKITMSEALNESPELRAECQSSDPLVRRTMELAKKLDGTIRQMGVHACGILISRESLMETIPVLPTPKGADKLMTTQYDGHFVEPIGLIKMDFLGLRTLSIIKAALANIKRAHKIDIDIDTVPLDDKKTFELFSRGETTGLFQFESAGMKKHMISLQPSKFEDLVAMNALYRPGPMEYIPNFIARKHGKEPITYDHPLMERYLKNTYGICVYQEQVMLLSRLLGNFTRGQSDSLRKAMGKKKIEEMNKLYDIFVNGCLKNRQFMEPLDNDEKRARELIQKIWDDWRAFASYAFNKSHAVCYAFIAYQTAYLKAHYPEEFMAAVLDSEISNSEKLMFLIGECANMGINVLGPDINSSLYGFYPDSNEHTIRFGFGGVKGMGERISLEIISERENNGKFKSFIDFMQRMSRKRVTVVNEETGEQREVKLILGKGVESLVLTGAFDSCPKYEDRKHLFNSIKAVLESIGKDGDDNSQMSLFDMGGDMVSLNDDLIRRDAQPMSNFEKLKVEYELLGLYLSGHPLYEFSKLDRALTNFKGEFKDCTLSKFDRHPIRLCGMVSDIRVKKTKDGLRQFMSFNLVTHTDTYDIFCFDDVENLVLVKANEVLYKGKPTKLTDIPEDDRNTKNYVEVPTGAALKNGFILEDGAIVAIEGELRYGKRKAKNGEETQAEWRFNVQSIRSLKEAVRGWLNSVTFILDTRDVEAVKTFINKKLFPQVGHWPGGTHLKIASYANSEKTVLVEADLGSDFTTSFESENFKNLAQDPVVLEYKIDAIPPRLRERNFAFKR